jgi:hypothetical protein
MKNLLFYLGFATLTTHELDAITQSEWKILIVLRSLPEEIASLVFVAAHVPIITLILWLTNHESQYVQYWSRIVVATFLMVHVGFHKLLEQHPSYKFNSFLSLSLIYGGGLIGFLYIALVFVSHRRYIVSKPIGLE